METLNTVLLSNYYDYIPHTVRSMSIEKVRFSRQQMIKFLEDRQSELAELETDLSKDYQIAIQYLRQMSDSDYQKLRGQLVPIER